jgi:hypothetical protein
MLLLDAMGLCLVASGGTCTDDSGARRLHTMWLVRLSKNCKAAYTTFPKGAEDGTWTYPPQIDHAESNDDGPRSHFLA